MWKLSSVDMCEIARNSVLQAGFEAPLKEYWLGSTYWRRDINGSDIRCNNVPDIRIQFRFEMLENEHKMLTEAAGAGQVDWTLIDRIM